MSVVTLYVSGDYAQTLDFYAQLNSYCGVASIVYSVLEPTVCSYGLDTPEKSDLFYAELVRLFGIYTSLNFTIV